MAWLPIAQTVPQYVDGNGDPYSGAVLKFYEDGTTTNTNMATDDTGGTTLADVVLDANGYPSNGGSVFIPHIDQKYKLALYPTEAAADADTGAIWTIDNLTAPVISASGTDELSKVSSNDTTAGYLNGKLIVGTNTVFTENSDGGNETLTIDIDTVYLAERADHAETPAAGSAEVWIKSDTPNTLYFTDDAGTDFQIGGDNTPGVLQVVNTNTGTQSSGTTLIPRDDTIPQNTEGDEYMTLAITPNDTANNLKIEVTWIGSNSVANNLIVALFQDSTADALAVAEVYLQSAGGIKTISFTHFMAAGTTSATTFKVRAGAELSGTTYFNGNATQKYGGVFSSSITITEISP
jgi:hypothetical protein